MYLWLFSGSSIANQVTATTWARLRHLPRTRPAAAVRPGVRYPRSPGQGRKGNGRGRTRRSDRKRSSISGDRKERRGGGVARQAAPGRAPSRGRALRQGGALPRAGRPAENASTSSVRRTCGGCVSSPSSNGKEESSTPCWPTTGSSTWRLICVGSISQPPGSRRCQKGGGVGLTEPLVVAGEHSSRRSACHVSFEAKPQRSAEQVCPVRGWSPGRHGTERIR